VVTSFVATWVYLVVGGIAGLGLGIGLVVGSAIVRELRRDGRHRDD
jgi:hypothetical protein